jgi:hypothetical protein
MIGVVLWSDANPRKAVIWCEDQGDLAFYTQKEKEAGVDLHEGDLIRFDLTLDRNFRRARNPFVIEPAAGMALRDQVPFRGPVREPAREECQIIAFPAGRAAAAKRKAPPEPAAL